MTDTPFLPSPETVKALALDLDGTILRPGAVLSDRTAAVLRACMNRGIAVILCTGRAVESAERFRLAIGAEGPMVCFNGAEVVNTPGGEILDLTLLDCRAAAYGLEIARQTGTYYQVFFPPDAGGSREILMAERDCPEAAVYRNHTGIPIEIGDLKAALAAPGLRGCVKSMFIAEPEAQEQIRPPLERRFGSGIYLARTYRTFLELMAAGVSKGKGLKLAMSHLGLEPAAVMAFGDEENDLPLFAAAGFSAAPANAQETVRAKADLVVGSNAQDGVAAFLERFFLR